MSKRYEYAALWMGAKMPTREEVVQIQKWLTDHGAQGYRLMPTVGIESQGALLVMEKGQPCEHETDTRSFVEQINKIQTQRSALLRLATRVGAEKCAECENWVLADESVKNKDGRICHSCVENAINHMKESTK